MHTLHRIPRGESGNVHRTPARGDPVTLIYTRSNMHSYLARDPPKQDVRKSKNGFEVYAINADRIVYDKLYM